MVTIMINPLYCSQSFFDINHLIFINYFQRRNTPPFPICNHANTTWQRDARATTACLQSYAAAAEKPPFISSYEIKLNKIICLYFSVDPAAPKHRPACAGGHRQQKNVSGPSRYTFFVAYAQHIIWIITAEKLPAMQSDELPYQ